MYVLNWLNEPVNKNTHLTSVYIKRDYFFTSTCGRVNLKAHLLLRENLSFSYLHHILLYLYKPLWCYFRCFSCYVAAATFYYYLLICEDDQCNRNFNHVLLNNTELSSFGSVWRNVCACKMVKTWYIYVAFVSIYI